ncbi:MAG: L-glyceraldehyde 3-phosphate reductase [Bacteroidota bacterium]|jgi:aryl-alcohol dehydrogenase-like predicted oxidoreductase
MKYKLLGKTGLRVSELSLGTMTFGEEWGWGASKEESKRIFDAYAGAGGNFLDTANRYTEGTSERYLGEFIAGDRDHFVVATKYSLLDRRGDPNFAGNHRKNMMRSIEGSLKRLGTDHIDLFYLHAWDFLTPLEEVLRGIDDLVRAGKILYAGISDTPAWIVSQANAIADLRGWTRFNALQIEYSLLQRTVERDLMPMAKSMDIAVTAWAALAGGALTGKYLEANDDPKRLAEGSSRLDERSRRITQAVVQVGLEHGCSPAQAAINWVRQKSQVVIPIIGARKASQMEDCLGCLQHPLPDAAIDRLDGASAIELGFPHEFLRGSVVSALLFSDQKELIDNHRI